MSLGYFTIVVLENREFTCLLGTWPMVSMENATATIRVPMGPEKFEI